jgi:hypothetical protein
MPRRPKNVPRWKRELEEVLRPRLDHAGDAWLDHDAALAINWVAEHLKHVEGSARGEPFVLRRWQAAIVGNLFGWKRKDEAGRVVRRYRQCLLFVARGNGKTPLAAAIVLYAFFEDGEPGAQCYLAAGQREQAGYLFRNAAGFIDQDPELTARVDALPRRPAPLDRPEGRPAQLLQDDPGRRGRPARRHPARHGGRRAPRPGEPRPARRVRDRDGQEGPGPAAAGDDHDQRLRARQHLQRGLRLRLPRARQRRRPGQARVRPERSCR